MPDSLLHLERHLFRRIPLEARSLLAFYWGIPIVFAEADLSDGVQVGDVMRLNFLAVSAAWKTRWLRLKKRVSWPGWKGSTHPVRLGAHL